MKENKLGSYLSSFSNKDWVAYGKFSRIFYSETSDYQIVINYIRVRKNRYNSSYMDVEYLRKNISPQSKKDTFSKVISNLCKYIEKYLAWAEVKNDSMTEDTLLLQALGRRGLSTQFHKQNQKSKEKRKNLPIGLWNNYHDFMAEYLMYFCNMYSDIKTGRVALEQTFSNLSNFNNVIKGYLNVEMHNRSTLLNENWSELFNDLELDELNNNKLKDVYINLMILKEKKEIESFNFLKSELFKEHLSKDLRYTILIHLTSFINGQKVRGKINDGKEILQLYQYGLENDLLFPSGLIPLIRYINIIGVACDVKEYTWAINFVNNYSNLVVSINIEEIKTLGFAQIEFGKNNFENVVTLLRDVKYKNFEVESRARWFLLCSNYELNKEDHHIMEYYIQPFTHFLRRNKTKITKLKSVSLINSVNYLSLIAKGKSLSKILGNIKHDKSLYTRKWLISKIVEKLDKQKEGVNSAY